MDKKTKKQLKHEKFLLKQQKNLKYNQVKKSIQIVKETFEKTKVGNFKIFSDLKNYDAEYVEHAWYDYWLKENHFKPRAGTKGHFSIIMPPPNITGKLHIGHALMLSIQDAIIRYKRMVGFETHYVPGLDHAGIATQSVVERTVERIIQEGCSNNEFDQAVYEILEKNYKYDNFAVKDILHKYLTKHSGDLISQIENISLKESKKEITKYENTLEIPFNKKQSLAYAWSSLHSNIILSQIMKMGTSCDWNYLTFTMDAQVNKIVNENFKKLYRDGLIVQKNRIVNYSGRLQSVISQIEVDNISVNSIESYEKYGEKTILGLIYKMKYFIRKKDSSAQMVKFKSANIFNEKYEKLLKKLYGVKIEEEAKILFKKLEDFYAKFEKSDEHSNFLLIETTRPETIIGDTAIAVHPSLYDKYKEYEAINPLTGDIIPIIPSSKVEKDFGSGMMKITPAHDKVDFDIAEEYNRKSSLLKISTVSVIDRDYNIVHFGKKYNRFFYRHVVIEILNRMGFLVEIKPIKNTVPLCSRTHAIIESIIMKQWYILTSEIKIPHEKLNVFPNKKQVENYLNNMEDWCISRQIWWGHQIPIYKKNGKYNIEEEGEIVGDVFDTWFSAALYPSFFKYPSSVLETGRDILLFWVIKMLLVNYQLTGELPFNTVLLHGLVRDKDNRKMSKSLGNAIDPIHIIDGVSLSQLKNTISIILNRKEREHTEKYIEMEFPNGIKECGSDALRMSLCRLYNPFSQRDIQYNYTMAEDYRVYMNKLWNASKLFFMQNFNALNLPAENKKLFMQYSAHKFSITIQKIHQLMDSYNLMEVLKELYDLSYYFFNIHIELMKLYDNFKESSRMFCDLMQMYSMFMPFMSEEIMQRHKIKFMHNFDSINLNEFPKYDNIENNRFSDILEEVQRRKKDKTYKIKNTDFIKEIQWLENK